MYPFEEDDDVMGKRMTLDNEKLLDLIQATVREWQSAEEGFLDQCDAYTIGDRDYLRAEELKELYQSLIREAKRRNLALSKEQLISQVIYTHSDKNNRDKT